MGANSFLESARLWVLQRCMIIITKKRAPDRIPMSGTDRLKVRDYSSALFIDPDGEGRFYFQGIDQGNIYKGIWWANENAGEDDRRLSLDELSKLKPDFTQYKGELEIRYSSSLEFLIYHYFRLPRLRLWIAIAVRWWLGKKTLVRNERIQVLRHMVDRVGTNEDEYLSVETLMNEFYGQSWWHTKRALVEHAYYRLLLKSMVATGDVEFSENHGYRIHPKALYTLSIYELEERRHRQLTWIQVLIVTLTLLTLITGGIQAGMATLAYFKPISASKGRY